MFTRRKREVAAPEVGAEAPEFNLPSAQGGQLRLSMRTVRGPVIVAFYRPGDEGDVEYFKGLAGKEEEINLASGSVVGIGVAEPTKAREFARETGLKSYLLYDYAKVTSSQWGLLERDKKNGDASRPAVFVVGPDHKVAHAWTGERPAPEELLEKVSAITGLPKSAEEKQAEPADPAADAGKPQKMSAEEREKIKAKRRAAREAGEPVKTADAGQAAPAAGDGPKKMSKEERERIKAERRAARESGQSLKTNTAAAPPDGATTEAAPEAPKKMSKEERERIKAERRAAREAGQSVKTGSSETPTPAETPAAEAPATEAPAEAPKKMSKEERERIKAERRAAREAGQSLKKPAGNEDAPPVETPKEGSPEKE